MPQSRSVFAVSLQEHPELLERIYATIARESQGLFFVYVDYFKTVCRVSPLRYSPQDPALPSDLWFWCSRRAQCILGIYQEEACPPRSAAMLYSSVTNSSSWNARVCHGPGAEDAIAAVFQVLEHDDDRGTGRSAGRNPPTGDPSHTSSGAPCRTCWTSISFADRVAWLEGVDSATAEQHAAAVLSVLAQYLPSPALLIALDGLPGEVRGLFNWIKKAA